MVKVELKPYPKLRNNFTINTGFRFGMGDNPPLLGQIPIPKGKPNCLLGNCFVISGTLPSLTRDQATSLIVSFGGRVVGSISGKTDVLVIGCVEVGPKKMSDAKQRGLPIIDEAGLFEIIGRTMDKDYHYPDQDNKEPEEVKPIVLEKEEEEIVEKQAPQVFHSMLSEKWRPRVVADLVGSNIPRNQLKEFLTNFKDSKKKIALVSGPSGIGKTSTVEIVCKMCGYIYHECNASDKRAKSEINQFISLINNKGISAKGLSKIAFVFDEIEGMSSGDRGGISAIADLASKTKVPIICITSDKNDKKLQPIVSIALDIVFPELQQGVCLQRLQYICQKESISISLDGIKSIIQESNCDLRNSLNALHFWGSSDHKDSSKNIECSDINESTHIILSPTSTFDSRFQASFIDSFSRLYVEENLKFPTKPSLKDLSTIADAFDFISIGDVMDNTLMQNTAWELSPHINVMGCVAPGLLLHHESFKTSRIDMPRSFKYSSKEKKLRSFVEEITNHINKYSTANSFEFISILSSLILSRVRSFESKTPSILAFLESLDLTLDDIDHINELVTFSGDNKNALKPTPELVKLYRSKHGTSSGINSKSEKKQDYLIVKTYESRKRR